MESLKEGCLQLLGDDYPPGRDADALAAPHGAGQPTPKEIDSLIASEMTRLSMEDRERALYDVHGIGENVNADSVLYPDRLMELETHLFRILAYKTTPSAFAEAAQMSPEYVQNPNFRIMFLRAEHFDAKLAAERLVRFFELKKRLFGRDRLVKDITLEDLDEDDMETLETGGVGQVSPLKDMAGRPIVCFLQALRKYKVPENAMRAGYYVFMSVMESLAEDKKGIVSIFYNINLSQAKSLNNELRNSLPIHFASLHLCCNDISEYAKVTTSIKLLNKHNRARYRLHYGSHVECLYELVTFGIPRTALPVTLEGELLTKDHVIWLERRRELEAERSLELEAELLAQTLDDEPMVISSSSTHKNSQSRDVHSPSTEVCDGSALRPDDVLFGRGKAVVDHQGNTQFRQIVDMYMSKYESAGRLEKTCIAEAIVHMIKEASGRFLKRDNGGDWEEVDDSTARKKVAHAFRNRRKLYGYGDI